MTYRDLLLAGLAAALAGCATDQHAANRACLQRPGCVSAFGDTGYGPVHSQAVAPDRPGITPPFP
jgi:hypothetical protein